MNKIQYIKLLELRGYTELPKGTSIADIVKSTGGEPSQEEMVKVNEEGMNYFIEKYNEQKDINKNLIKNIEYLNKCVTELTERNDWLNCLEEAGLYNWEGYDSTKEHYDEMKAELLERKE